MAETTADVRRDIELTRERMSTTLSQLEQKMNLMQIVKDHPWPALAVALGAGVVLSGSRADVKAAAATVTATRGASGRIGEVLDDLVSHVVAGVSGAFQDRVEGLVNELKGAIGAPVTRDREARTATSGSTGASAAWSPHTGDPRQALGGESQSASMSLGALEGNVALSGAVAAPNSPRAD